MAANIFGRYVWLIEQFRRYGRLTYEEINDHWHKSGLSYGDGDNLALRTFHNHRKAIFDIFEVEIVCDIKGGYKYYISNPEELESDNLRIWLIDSYTAMNQIQADRKLKGRIISRRFRQGTNGSMSLPMPCVITKSCISLTTVMENPKPGILTLSHIISK